MEKKHIEQYIKSDPDYYMLVDKILNSSEFQKRKAYMHHEHRTVYDHCLMVSYYSYKMAKRLHCDVRSAAIGGLLHDFYDKPWQTKDNKLTSREKKHFFEQHGFVHAGQAVQNSWKYYPEVMNGKIENIIMRHMFPLNIHPPRYKESWIVTIVDKYVSMEVLKTPSEWLKYIGIKTKKNSVEEVKEKRCERKTKDE